MWCEVEVIYPRKKKDQKHVYGYTFIALSLLNSCMEVGYQHGPLWNNLLNALDYKIHSIQGSFRCGAT